MTRSIAMARTFHPSLNTISRASVFGLVLVICCAGWIGWKVQESPYVTDQGIIREQPVPFSHEHHAGGLGIDCRFCHTTVEDLAFAGMPTTKTCMTCHSQIWTNAPMLQPVRDSLARRDAAGLAACEQPAGVCLFQPQHSRSKRSRLRHLPRAASIRCR